MGIFRRRSPIPTTPVPSTSTSSDLPERSGKWGLFPLNNVKPRASSDSGPYFPIDIVAIHGITGDAYTTWTAANNHFWLQDSLPKEFPGARIFSYGYPADVFMSLGTGKIDQFAEDLLGLLYSERTTREEKRRPIIFICHSMGGIIVKKALVNTVLDPRYKSIRKSVTTILFLSTPHRGSKSADLLEVIGQIANVSTLGTMTLVRTDLVKALRRDSEILSRIATDFRHQSSDYVIYSFVEQEITPPLKIRIVDELSAYLNVSKEVPIPMQGCNHQNICRFSSEKELGYTRIRGALREAANNAIFKLTTDFTEEDIPCLHSLSFPTYALQTTPHTKTCTWIHTHPLFLSWYRFNESTTSLLYLKGHPGTGKSTMLSYLYNHFSTSPSLQSGDAVLYFAFQGSGSFLQRSEIGMLRSLVQQLYTQNLNARARIFAAYEEKKRVFGEQGTDWEWGVVELRGLLEESLLAEKGEREIWIFVDALDEAVDERGKAAEGLVRFFGGLGEKLAAREVSEGGKTRICLSCRHYPVIAASKGISISMEEENEGDVRAYVDDILSTGIDDWALESSEKRTELVETIVKKAAGLFLWLNFTLPRLTENLNDGVFSFDAAKDVIENQSNDLNLLYTEIINRDVKPALREKSLLFMQWVSLAERPLRVQEMRYAMVLGEKTFDFGNATCEEMEEFVPEDKRMERLVKSLSGGLAEVRKQDGGGIIQLFHQTVREFMREGGLKTLHLFSSSQLSEATDREIEALSEERLKVACFNYLRLDSILGRVNFISAGAVVDEAFVSYASNFFLTHAERAEQQGFKQDGWIRMLDKYPDPDILRKLRNIMVVVKAKKCPNSDTTLLHVACMWNLESAVVYLLNRGALIDARDWHGQTALHHAARWGYENIVNLLLDSGADIDAKKPVDASKEIYFSANTPLTLAAKNGHNSVVRCLLKRGAGMDVQTGESGTALQAAIESENFTLAKLLVNAGAELNIEDGKYGTALQAAAYKCNHEVVKLLIEKGADVNSKSGYYGSALNAAIFSSGPERDAIIDLLFDSEADVSIQGGTYGNALQTAVQKHDLAFVEMLLGGVDVNATGGYYHTALQAACQTYNLEMIRLLVDHGADVNAQGGEYGTSLQAAVNYGEKEIVQYLLSKGASVNAQGGKFGSALQAAAAGSAFFPDLVPLLIKNGANIQVQGGFFGNMLQAAAYSGHMPTIKLFLDAGLDINQSGGEHGSVLQAAMAYSKPDAISYLLDMGADINAQGGKLGCVLAAAKFHRREDLIPMLLERGAKLEQRSSGQENEKNNIE